LAEKGEFNVSLQTDYWTDLWGYIADPYGLKMTQTKPWLLGMTGMLNYWK
jgi:uncharacterized glyoxalase superfamily protein PhnB